MEWFGVLGFVVIFGFFIVFVGYVADFDYLESKLLSTLFPQEEYDSTLIQNIQQKIIIIDSSLKTEEKLPLPEEKNNSFELSVETLDNELICLELISQVFANLNPTQEDLDEIEKKLKENNCGT